MQTNSEAIDSIKTDDTSYVLDEIEVLKKQLGDDVFILGHHYQRDNIIGFSDRIGDSFGLSKYVAEEVTSPNIIFCGVHFMAETADILTSDDKNVILPDLQAGCSMADMADIYQVEECWENLKKITDEKIIPITYMNSTAALKAFCGRNGGTVCTSSNAEKILQWAFKEGQKVLFFPDQHLGRNTAYKMGIALDQMPMWDPDPSVENGGATAEEYQSAKVILWKGFCSVHMNFRPHFIDLFRDKYPGINILVHPECEFETVKNADYVGSTDYILKTIESAEPNSKWAIGTENHLVERLKNQNPDKFIIPLSEYACNCATMYRIDPEHLLNVLKELAAGNVVNKISVPAEVTNDAKIALQKMLDISK